MAGFLIEETRNDGVNIELVNGCGIEGYNEGIITIRESLSQGNDEVNILNLKVGGLETVRNVPDRGNPCLH